MTRRLAAIAATVLLTAGLAGVGWPASAAVSEKPAFAGEYEITYYNNAQHSVEVGEKYFGCINFSQGTTSNFHTTTFLYIC